MDVHDNTLTQNGFRNLLDIVGISISAINEGG